jgi:ribonuclease P protein component
VERGQKFPREIRLRRRGDYLRVQRDGRKVHSAHFLALGVSTPGQPTRLGITVSRKVGDAVRRNRVKRLLREAFRLHREIFPTEMELVLIAKTGAPELGLPELCEELRVAFRRSRR